MTPSEANALVSRARRLPFQRESVIALESMLRELVPSAGPDLLVTIDGASATGKDTQIGLLIEALLQNGFAPRLTSVSGVRSIAGNVISLALMLNRANRHSRQWEADLLLKLAGWRTTVASFDNDRIVISNRSGLSAIAYSAATMRDCRLAEEFAPTLTSIPTGQWMPILLTCQPDVAVRRARERADVTQQPLRYMDRPEFIAAVNKVFGQLKTLVPILDVEGSMSREPIHACITAAVLMAAPTESETEVHHGS